MRLVARVPGSHDWALHTIHTASPSTAATRAPDAPESTLLGRRVSRALTQLDAAVARARELALVHGPKLSYVRFGGGGCLE